MLGKIDVMGWKMLYEIFDGISNLKIKLIKYKYSDYKV